MFMERLFNHFGEPLVFGGALLLIVLPLVAAGIILRRRASRKKLRWGMVESARRALRDVTAGRVAVVGTWRRVGETRGIVEDGEHCAIVDHGGEAAVKEGERVLVAAIELRSARIAGSAGTALLALGVAVAMAFGGLCYRAALDQANLVTNHYDTDS
jgi:hypothetical protein